MTKDMAERIKDGKVVMKSKDPEIQAALNKKVDELTGTKPAPTKVPKNKSTVKPGPTKVPKIKAKPKKLAGGGIAIKGQGKAFLKSKR